MSRYSSATAASQAFSRSVPAPLACPAAAAARPASSDVAGRLVVNGLPHQLRAMPQCAMAHVGSLASTFWNDATAAENQNECNCATPRSKSPRTPAAQDVGKCTEPSRSPGFPWACASCGCDAAGLATTRTLQANAVMEARPNRMVFLRDVRDGRDQPTAGAPQGSTCVRPAPHTAESPVDQGRPLHHRGEASSARVPTRQSRGETSSTYAGGV